MTPEQTKKYFPEESEVSKAWNLIHSHLIDDVFAGTYRDRYEELLKSSEEKIESLRIRYGEKSQQLQDRIDEVRSERDTALEENIALKMRLAANLGVQPESSCIHEMTG